MFLIAQRGPSQSHAGMWELPGGKIDQNETPEQALVREINEELRATIRVGRRLTPVVHEYPSFIIELVPFLAVVEKGNPTPGEHSRIEWIQTSQIGEFEWTEADIPVVNEYARLRKPGIG